MEFTAKHVRETMKNCIKSGDAIRYAVSDTRKTAEGVVSKVYPLFVLIHHESYTECIMWDCILTVNEETWPLFCDKWDA